MLICANPQSQFHSYQDEIEQAVLRVMRSERYILGPEVDSLEREFAEYITSGYAIGVANGTDAIEISLRALDVQPCDEVITVSHTAVATVAAIESTGAIPVLVDVDPNFYTLNPDQLEEVLTSRTRAVVVVHIYGQSADLESICAFCEKYGLALIEDASQAHGAKWQGRRLGSIGHVGCFSCYPTKNLGAIGDAGLITTNNEQLANKIRMLREYGWQERYISSIPGRNSRLDEIQAAILRVKLSHLDRDNAKRCELAKQYSTTLSGVVQTPRIREGVEHVFHLYVVQTDRRNKLIEQLRKVDIHPAIHYPVPIHLQPAYQGRVRTARSMAVTEALASRILSLPIYPELSANMGRNVVDAIMASESQL